MCSTCNVNNFELIDGVYKNQLGAQSLILELSLCTKNKKDFYIKAELCGTDEQSMFVVYKCPTCGKRLF